MARVSSTPAGIVRNTVRRIVPHSTRLRLSRALARASMWPRPGRVDFGDLGRVTPIDRDFGFGRGKPVDRFYIDRFLAEHADAMRGRVLEIGDSHYTERFADRSLIERIDVLDVDPDNTQATIVADLADAAEVPSDCFDCVVCPQTLLLVYDLAAAVETVGRVLRPGGTALVTVPGISQACRSDKRAWLDYWRLTKASATRLFEGSFPTENVRVQAHGNVLVAAAFLYGLAAEDLPASALEVKDPDYELIIGISATKPR